jgi:ribosomal protein S18 acetylase RimI-like enzyme
MLSGLQKRIPVKYMTLKDAYSGRMSASLNRNCDIFLLRDNNSAVGFGITLKNKLRNGKYKGRIYSIGVLPACRSIGGGRLLLDAMEKYLIKSNASLIVLETLKGKGGAGLFFTRHGYMESKFLPNYYP